MKPRPLQLLKLSACFLLATIIQSCSNEAGVWKNDQIQQSTRDNLNELNDKAFNYIKSHNTNDLESMMSKELIEDKTTVTIAERISHEMGVDSFKKSTEYYIVNKHTTKDTVNALDEGINSHRLIYPAGAQEMYVVMYLPVNNKLPNKSMITAYYTHYNYGWKLSDLDLGLYTINGKTAPELYDLAKQEYSKGYLVSASDFLTLARTCARPNQTWKYEVENELYKFAANLDKEVNDKYLFPIPLKISTEPLFTGLLDSPTDEGTFPVISYQTKIPLKNLEAIKKEKDNVKKAVIALMPGIDKNRKYLIFSAYNELPSRTTTVAHYDMKEKLE